MKRLHFTILLSVLLGASCGQPPAPAQPNLDPTAAFQSALATAAFEGRLSTAAFQNQLATALAGTLAAQVQPGYTPIPSAAAAAPSATLLPPETIHPLPSPFPGSIPLAYDEKVGSVARQGSQTYTFEGVDGDLVTVMAELTNLHPDRTQCAGVRSASLTFLDDAGHEIAPVGTGSNPQTQKIYELPYTGRYYLALACQGLLCDGRCTELDLIVKKQ